MHELDRILDAQDVRVFVFVDVVDMAISVVDLPKPGRSGHQDQALRLLDQLAEHARATRVFEGQHFRGMVRNTAPAPRFG